jgi:hypothetical protein
VRLQPLGHLSNKPFQTSFINTDLRAQTLMFFGAFGNSLAEINEKTRLTIDKCRAPG